MTAPYKKRAKAGWNSDKEISNRSERAYERADINDQNLALKNQNLALKKKPKLSWKEKEIKRMLSDLRYAFKLSKGDIENLNHKEDEGSWSRQWKQTYYQKCKKYLPRIKTTVNDEDISNKVKKQMREILDMYGEV